MERFKKYAAPALCAFLILLTTFLLKSVPASKLWKGYTTLSVPAGTDSALVNDVLREQNCRDYISLEGQLSARQNEYQKRKSLYFFDKDKQFKLYYIPDAFSREAGRAVQLLQSNFHINAFLGSKAVFSRLPFLVCALAFLALFFYAENRLAFTAAAAPGLFYAFCNPYYAASAAICLELYALYLGQRLWRRKGALKAVLNNPYILMFSAAAFLLSCAAGFKRSFLFTLNLLCAFSLLLLLFNRQVDSEKNARFLPVNILSARRLGAMTFKKLRKAFFVSAEILVLFICLCAGTNCLTSASGGDLLFPAPKDYNESERTFPTLEDYYADRWDKLASPYRSLNKQKPGAPKDGESVEMTHYVKTEKGIQSKREVLFTFNKDFKKEAASAIDSAPSSSLEKLWRAQGQDFSVDYSAGGSEKSGPGLVVAMLFAALLPFFAAARYILILRRGKYEA